VARRLGLQKPWEQLGLYGSFVGGCAYAARQYYRAHCVVQYVASKNVEHLYLADVPATSDAAARALFLVSRLRVRGIAALGAPLVWLAWRTSWETRVWQAGSSSKPAERP
jgi:hypothetical protein